jgi:predicted transcriptional regulator
MAKSSKIQPAPANPPHARPQTGGASFQPLAAKRGERALSGLETEVMQVVWKRGTVSAGEVREALLPARPLAHTTILTVLENLRKKKAVRVVPSVGREKKFRAAVAKETVAGQLLGSLRRRFFNGSAASLVAHLIESGNVDDAELQEIRDLIRPGKNRT